MRLPGQAGPGVGAYSCLCLPASLAQLFVARREIA